MNDWEKEFVDYFEFGTLCDQLVDVLKEEEECFDFIYGEKRGAWPIVTHLSHHLDIPVLNNVDQLISLNDDSYVLLVDDVCDTGITFKSIVKYLYCSYSTATLYTKPWADFDVDYSIRITEKWPVFPWEKLEEEPNREFPKVEKIRKSEKLNDFA